MLPMLRWLEIALHPPRPPTAPDRTASRTFGDLGAHAIAAALRGLALPSLEIFACCGECTQPNPDADDGLSEGCRALAAACEAHQIVLHVLQT